MPPSSLVGKKALLLKLHPSRNSLSTWSKSMAAASVASSLKQQPNSCQMFPKQKARLKCAQTTAWFTEVSLTAHLLSSVFFTIHSVSLSGSYAALGC